MANTRKNKISKRQQSIYDFICEYTKSHGYPPSVREIGTAVGLASPSTVHMHLKSLEEKGYIHRDQNKPRTIELVEQDRKAVGQADGANAGTVLGSEEGLASVLNDPNTNSITLPLVGRVAAGTPILAEQNVEEMLTLPTSVVGDASSFILRVKGVSMINAGIFDGDYIVVKEQHDAHDGEIVVALIDDSATVKTFYHDDGCIRLQPENDQLKPIYVKNPIILGKVTALIRAL